MELRDRIRQINQEELFQEAYTLIEDIESIDAQNAELVNRMVQQHADSPDSPENDLDEVKEVMDACLRVAAQLRHDADDLRAKASSGVSVEPMLRDFLTDLQEQKLASYFQSECLRTMECTDRAIQKQTFPDAWGLSQPQAEDSGRLTVGRAPLQKEPRNIRVRS